MPAALRPWACRVPSSAGFGWKTDTPEARNNAIICWRYLAPLGWTRNAVAAMLGNIGGEGAYNPWSWQDGVVLPSTDIAGMKSNDHGYGLFGFTPSSRYLLDENGRKQKHWGPLWSDIPGTLYDGYAQLDFMLTVPDQWHPAGGLFNLTFREYQTSTGDVQFLTEAWMRQFEKPASYVSLPKRQRDALYWYDFLKGEPSFTGRRKMPLWMKIQYF